LAKFTIVVSEAPYGREKAYTSLRFALTALLDGHKVNIFLVQDGVYAAKKNQNPAEFPSILAYLEEAIREGASVKLCTPCASARGISQEDVVNGAKLGTMHDLVAWAAESDQVMTI
jgi:tRNA 2-thiouridine synthesizing protein D